MKKFARFLAVAVVLVIPTQYGVVTCTSDQIQEYLDWIPKEEDAKEPVHDADMTEQFRNALRNA